VGLGCVAGVCGPRHAKRLIESLEQEQDSEGSDDGKKRPLLTLTVAYQSDVDGIASAGLSMM
jgi:hypothetical protein